MVTDEETSIQGWYALYTRALREPEVADQVRAIPGVEEVLLPVFHHLKPHEPKGIRVIGLNELMFPNYVLFRAVLTKQVAREILRAEGAAYLLGTSPDSPSPIAESEIALVRHLSNAERDPRLGEAPVKGRVARVIAGPLTGVEGLVLWRNRHEARLATHLRMAAGSYEVRLPLGSLALSVECKWSTGEASSPRHRGGRRGRGGRTLAT